LFDGLGAVLTAFTHGFILTHFHELLGVPSKPLVLLSFVAVGYAIYSFTCAFLIKNQTGTLLKVIAIANLLFCVATIYLMIFHRATLTNIGIGYFLIEIAVLIAISRVEWKRSFM